MKNRCLIVFHIKRMKKKHPTSDYILTGNDVKICLNLESSKRKKPIRPSDNGYSITVTVSVTSYITMVGADTLRNEFLYFAFYCVIIYRICLDKQRKKGNVMALIDASAVEEVFENLKEIKNIVTKMKNLGTDVLL